jgi:hypothetical protein
VFSRTCNNTSMITHFLNWIRNIFKPERQDPHLVLYEEVKPKHCIEHTRYKKSCKACQEITS